MVDKQEIEEAGVRNLKVVESRDEQHR